MSGQLKFYIDNKPSPPPFNWQELEVELSFENNRPAASIKTNSFEFLGETAQKLNDYFDEGLTGGKGVFEGVPFRIEISDASTVPFDGFIDLSSQGTKFECDKITTKAVESGGIDWLNDIADSFSFAFLSDTNYSGNGKISVLDYIKVPYVVSEIPDYTQSAIMAISSFIVFKEIYEITKAIARDVADLLLAAAASVATAGVSVAWQIALIAAEVTYLSFLIIAIKNLVNSISNNIIQGVKHKLAMRVSKHFERACEYLGLEFSSSLLASGGIYEQLTIIPRKTIIPGSKIKDEDLSGKYTGHFDGTFGDFIRAMNDLGNCEVKIIDGTLYWEKKKFFDKKADYKLPNINISRSPYEINASELSSNYYIKYQLDDSDLNTYDDYEGTSAQVIIQPIAVKNQKNVTLKNLDQKSLQFALAKRKTELTAPEKVLKFIINDVYGLLVAQINKIPGVDIEIPDEFKNRIGWMKLSSDFIAVPKIAIIRDDGYISESNQQLTSAEYLLENFHSVNLATRDNQYYIYRDKEIPLGSDDFVKIKNNNFIKTYGGEDAKVDSLIWNPHKGTAKITYRVQRDFTKNLQEKVIIDGN